MNTLPPYASKDKPHYTYTLEYPEDYPEPEKAGTVFYVGKGKGKRLFSHERQAYKGVKSHKCSVIRKIWNADCQVIKRVLAYFASNEEACMYEIALIFFMDGLTNKTIGGDGIQLLLTEEELHRRSEAAKTSPRVRMHILQLNAARKGKPGRPFTEEQRSQHSKTLKTSPRALKQREQLAESRKGSSLSEKQCRQISDTKKKQGLKHTEERKRQNSECNMGKECSEETRRRMSKARKQLWEWLSFEEARAYVHTLGIKTHQEWRAYYRSGQKPTNIPCAPNTVYKEQWKSWGDWLSTHPTVTFIMDDLYGIHVQSVEY